MAKNGEKTASDGDASITDVAKRAKVSVGTVSRVFNDHPSVDAGLRRRVQIASRQLGFVPRVQHRCIGLVIGRRNPDVLPISFVSVMTTLISQYLADSHYSVELIDAENIELLYEAHTQGAIGLTFDDSLLEAREIPKLPLLTINHPMVAQGIHAIYADHHRQGLLATEHLIQRGHRAIGLLVVTPGEWGTSQRIAGYRQAMEAAGLEVDPSWIQSTTTQKTYDILGRWTSHGVTAVLNFSEYATFETMHILSNILRLKIGENISMISLEDMAIYQYLSPPQTTVHQPLSELARLAVQTMLDLCANKSDGKQEVLDICLPTQLIERDSVATLK
jgi:LacI family transcriptional regulator